MRSSFIRLLFTRTVEYLPGFNLKGEMNIPHQNPPPPFPNQTGIPTARITKKAQPVKETRSLAWYAIAIFAVLLVLTVGVRGIKKRLQHQETQAHIWSDNATCSATCSIDGYSKPPLVIISFDGFKRDYLDEPGWVKWLKKVGDCGVRAEKVFPSYPTSTFVNHYSIVTGQYSESHGIVSNSFWDKDLNPEGVEWMGETKNDKYFLGEPIWSIYRRLTGGKANCFMWPLSSFNNHGYPCNAIAYNISVPLQERMDTVRNWLLLPESERPGLILTYFNEPDSTGHGNMVPKNSKEFGKREKLREKVTEMDNAINRFLQQMADDGLLNCVNFAFVSDHGMQYLEKVIYIDDLIKTRQQFVGGTVGMVYAEQPVIDEFISNATEKCTENNSDFLLSTDETRPLRYHHSNSKRISPLLIEGRPGVVISDPSFNKNVTGGHGYDYLTKGVQTMFFATGPSFQQGAVLPPFQNVEYLNLWLDLLGIDPNTVSNNGTVGTMDAALKKRPSRRRAPLSPIEKCSSPSDLEVCCSTQVEKCEQLAVSELFSSSSFCYDAAKTLCGKGILHMNGTTKGVVEVIDRKMIPRCTVEVKNDKCGEGISLAADPSVDIISLRSSLTGVFINEVFPTLEKFLKVLLKQYGRAVVLSGTAVDRDRNGLADSDQSQPPSHFFRLFLFCRDGRWSPEGTSCASPDQLDSRSFAFPIIETEPNCLKGVELLRYYSCRLRDIELVAEIEVVAQGMNDTQRVQLRTKIDEDFLM